MKQVIVITVGILLSFVISAKEIITVSSGEWPPFTGKDLKHGGFCTHLLEKAMTEFELQVTYFPWKRAAVTVMDGEMDVTPCWIPNEERMAKFIFSDPLMVNKKVFFHRKDFNFNWDTIDDLQPYRIGTALGYSYGDEFDRAAKENRITIEPITDDATNLRKLLLGRIDLFPVEMVVGYTTLYEIFPAAQASQITNHDKALLKSSYHLMISRKISRERAEQILSSINHGLKRLKESGEYGKLESLLIEGYYNP
ncbi:substrate-binding periplasmic protein [Hahella ganghwensis]|uniref:substrate-binding periplasmic protein n=1 Tax=Hahella ganghwensis TaxID=286420 RepID=UPI00037241F1|nr:transporter substrate-binding domain-containing protein [Hahella ganghwensis]